MFIIFRSLWALFLRRISWLRELYPLGQGEVNGHGGSLSKSVARYGYCTPVRFDYGSGDGQSQSVPPIPRLRAWPVRQERSKT